MYQTTGNIFDKISYLVECNSSCKKLLLHVIESYTAFFDSMAGNVGDFMKTLVLSIE